jgi:hypothetical protein
LSDYTSPETVTVTVMVVVWETPPIVPVTVTVYVPGAVSRGTETVRTAEP